MYIYQESSYLNCGKKQHVNLIQCLELNLREI